MFKEAALKLSLLDGQLTELMDCSELHASPSLHKSAWRFCCAMRPNTPENPVACGDAACFPVRIICGVFTCSLSAAPVGAPRPAPQCVRAPGQLPARAAPITPIAGLGAEHLRRHRRAAPRHTPRHRRARKQRRRKLRAGLGCPRGRPARCRPAWQISGRGWQWRQRGWGEPGAGAEQQRGRALDPLHGAVGGGGSGPERVPVGAVQWRFLGAPSRQVMGRAAGCTHGAIVCVVPLCVWCHCVCGAIVCVVPLCVWCHCVCGAIVCGAIVCVVPLCVCVGGGGGGTCRHGAMAGG
jgi:hypothetical protein